MTIAPAILEHFPDLNPAQLKVIGHLDGPLLVIAGPGVTNGCIFPQNGD